MIWLLIGGLACMLLLLAGLIAAAARGSRYEEQLHQENGWDEVRELMPEHASTFRFYDDTPIYHQLKREHS